MKEIPLTCKLRTTSHARGSVWSAKAARAMPFFLGRAATAASTSAARACACIVRTSEDSTGGQEEEAHGHCAKCLPRQDGCPSVTAPPKRLSRPPWAHRQICRQYVLRAGQHASTNARTPTSTNKGFQHFCAMPCQRKLRLNPPGLSLPNNRQHVLGSRDGK